MTRVVAVALVLCSLGMLSVIGCSSARDPGDAASGPSPVPITLQLLVSGLAAPLDLEQPDDGTGRLFVVEQGGTIKIIQNGAVLPQPFLDISSKVTNFFEMGLLGVAFHPDFRQNRRFFVNYVRTEASGQIQSVIAEYQAPASNANQADAASERILLVVDQVGNFPNHKAGQLGFGPDGFLYFGLGDGGSGSDPFGNGQNTQTLLGKMMRIDVDSASPTLQYGIPADNPFAAGGGLPEIYAIGFRNPYRFSFDGPTGRLIVADVGQDAFEEVDIVRNGGNYGWNVMEGLHCFIPPAGCNMTGLSLPITEIPHPEGEAVIGGFVYHGTALTGWQGIYIFGDLNGSMWSLREGPPSTFTRTLIANTSIPISSFGQDQNAELYVVDYNGRVLKIVAQ